MKTIQVILIYLVILLSMVFFFQNTKLVVVQVYLWVLELPLIAVLIAALILGMLIAALILMPFILKKNKIEKSKLDKNENRKEFTGRVKEKVSG